MSAKGQGRQVESHISRAEKLRAMGITKRDSQAFFNSPDASPSHISHISSQIIIPRLRDSAGTSVLKDADN